MRRTSSPRCWASERVYLTRAAKIDGVPTVPSRWLLRLQALLGGVGQQTAADAAVARLGAGAQCRWPVAPARARAGAAPALSSCGRASSASRPSRSGSPIPTPSSPQRILGLEPLPAARATGPDAALRGQIVHEALSRFAQRFPDQLPDDHLAPS